MAQRKKRSLFRRGWGSGNKGNVEKQVKPAKSKLSEAPAALAHKSPGDPQSSPCAPQSERQLKGKLSMGGCPSTLPFAQADLIGYNKSRIQWSDMEHSTAKRALPLHKDPHMATSTLTCCHTQSSGSSHKYAHAWWFMLLGWLLCPVNSRMQSVPPCGDRTLGVRLQRL